MEEEKEKVNSKSLFNPKPFKDANFWFTKGFIKSWIFLFKLFYWLGVLDTEEQQAKLETTDILETVTGTPSIQKAVKEEENKILEKEEKLEIKNPLLQQVENIKNENWFYRTNSIFILVNSNIRYDWS